MSELLSGGEDARLKYLNQSPEAGRPTVAAVMTSFNKCEDVRKNLDSQRAQTIKFDQIIVVDNASSDGTQKMIRQDYPEVTFVEMPHPAYGACETFNIGFSTAGADFVAILDDDIILPTDWVEKMLAKFESEPETTGLISSKVVEPNMPDWYLQHPGVNQERYMATFRGCATLAKHSVIRDAGYYDVRFFIYGNERDLSCRVLNSGFRILQFPSCVVQHGTPFGMKKGARSLYYHVRNLWLYLFKNVAWTEVFGFVMGQISPFGKKKDTETDAVGTIGFFETVRQTKGGFWVCIKATINAFLNLPYCLKHRKVCQHEDFRLPTE
ncbi:MAG: glycosyltransferase family 2 protein [Planctomycetota bacterium]